MAEEEYTTNLGRSDVTVTDFLFLLQPSSTIDEHGKVLARSSTKLPYKGTGQLVAEDPLFNPDPTVKARGSLVPEQSSLPIISAEVRKTPDGGATTVSISPRDVPVSYSREWYMGDGPSTKDILQGRVGPFGAYFSELRGDGERDLVGKTYGASARMGPVTLYGEQSRASWEDRDPRTGQRLRDMDYAKYLENTRINEQNRKIGVATKGSFGKGVAGLDVARTYRDILLPNRRGQPRSTVSAPNVTSLGARWQGPLGPGRLNLTGDMDFIRDRGTSSNFGANYTIENPLGLGGMFKAQAGWQNPYGGPSDLQAGLRYGWRR
jgi:hypothetical protein